jgi:hypothetical protein
VEGEEKTPPGLLNPLKSFFCLSAFLPFSPYFVAGTMHVHCPLCHHLDTGLPTFLKTEEFENTDALFFSFPVFSYRSSSFMLQ